MSPLKKQERVFDPAFANELLQVAQGDFESASLLFQANPTRKENILLLVQQSVEKVLKAVLVAKKLPVPLVHDLGILIAKIPSDLEFPVGYEITSLSDFAGGRRYGLAVTDILKEDIEAYFQESEKILQWATTIIKTSLR